MPSGARYHQLGAPGYCPPPDDPAFTSGLSAGHHCVRLTLQDGGANDADGQVNGRIRSTGGLVEKAPPERVEAEGTGALSWRLACILLLAVAFRRRHLRRAP